MGLLQKDVAELLGVNTWTVLNWEKGHAMPPIAAIPAILNFLCYGPFPRPMSVAQHLAAKRREKGWAIKDAAEVIGVDAGTWGDWERGRMILYRRHRARVAKLLGLSSNALHREMAVRWNQLHEPKR